MTNVTSGTSEDLGRNSIGLLLAIIGTVSIGGSFVVNKLSLQKLNAKGSSTSLVSLHYQFIKQPLWWLSQLLLAAGEILNFSAYVFSPASLVTPLGALSVVFTCIFSSWFLKERLNIITKSGVGLALIGSFFIALHAPHQEPINNLDVLREQYLSQTSFLIYAIFFQNHSHNLEVKSNSFYKNSHAGIQLIAIAALFTFQNRHYIFRIILASFSGAFCVIATKSVGIAVTQIFSESLKAVASKWITYVMLLVLVLSIVLQMVQITRALNQAETSTVMPIYYIIFTVSVMVGMNILFKEYQNVENAKQALSIVAGFLVLCISV